MSVSRWSKPTPPKGTALPLLLALAQGHVSCNMKLMKTLGTKQFLCAHCDFLYLAQLAARRYVLSSHVLEASVGTLHHSLGAASIGDTICCKVLRLWGCVTTSCLYQQ